VGGEGGGACRAWTMAVAAGTMKGWGQYNTIQYDLKIMVMARNG